MPLITSGEVVESFDISAKSKIDAQRFDRYVIAALAKLESWVRDTVWAEANLNAPGNADQAEILKAAAIELVMYFALPNLNTYLTENGIILSAQNEGNTVMRYLSPKEIVEKQAAHWNTAKEMISAYAPFADRDGDGFVDSVFEYTESCPVQIIW